MDNLIAITSAQPQDWPAALDLVLQHLPEDQRRGRCANTLALLGAGELRSGGIFLARQEGDLCGALVCWPLPGASALFWPPQTKPGYESSGVAENLVRHALNWLRGQGTKLAQALVPPREMPHARTLLDCGFRHVSQLCYMRHELVDLPRKTHMHIPLKLETYQPGNRILFHETLLKTYEGTLDCPELNGRRELEEILEGHRQSKFRPDLWWLAFVHEQAVGVVMLTEQPGWEGWDLAYVGVVPAARRQGIGLVLTEKALQEAFRSGMPQMILGVDARNLPARQLYEKIGFVEEDRREILLFFFAS